MAYGQETEEPIVKPAAEPTTDPAHSAAIIFLHGLDDDAHGWEGKTRFYITLSLRDLVASTCLMRLR